MKIICYVFIFCLMVVCELSAQQQQPKLEQKKLQVSIIKKAKQCKLRAKKGDTLHV